MRINPCGVVVAVILAASGPIRGDDRPSNVDRARPEQSLFAFTVAEAMKAHHAKFGEYPKEWRALEISFANGPYHLYDPDVRPTKMNRESWKPRDCKYVYVIKRADKDGYLIHAVGEGGKAEYEIRTGDPDPKPIR